VSAEGVGRRTAQLKHSLALVTVVNELVAVDSDGIHLKGHRQLGIQRVWLRGMSRS
jgi:hypothetical protein